MLFNEPKLLKCEASQSDAILRRRFSALQRAEIAEMFRTQPRRGSPQGFSALQRAEIAEIGNAILRSLASRNVSVLFNEPKLLKFIIDELGQFLDYGFSALQRAEIAEISNRLRNTESAVCFSALQRAEIAEMPAGNADGKRFHRVSVLFNEPKLLKSFRVQAGDFASEEFQCSSTSRNC